MPEQNETFPTQDLIQKTLADAKSLAREQVSAAWQLQVEKIQEQLSSGFQDHISHVLDERFQEMEEQLGPSLTAEFTAREVDLRRSLVAHEETLAAREQEVGVLQSAQAALERSLGEKEANWQSALAEKETQWQATLSSRENEWQSSLAAKENDWSQTLAAQLAERESATRAAAEQREQELVAQLAEREAAARAAAGQYEETLATQLAERDAAARAAAEQYEQTLAAQLAEREGSIRAAAEQREQELAAQLAERDAAARAAAEQHQQELAARAAELQQSSGANENEWTEKLNAALAEKEAQFAGRLKVEIDAAAREAQAQAEDAAQQAIHEASVSVRKSVTRELSERLNQSVRRLASAGSFDQWREALLDGAAIQADRVLVFGISESSAMVEAARGVDNAQGLECSLQDMPALVSAIDTKDTVVAVRTTSEFGERIADMAPETKGAKVYLFPVQVKDRVAAVLYAEPGEAHLEVSTLELLASVAALSLTARRAAEQKAAAAAAIPAPAAPAGTVEGLASLMTSLSREEQDLHLRAQRFARVQVAEMRLYKSTLVKEGRSKQNIYGTLREEIELSREAFRVQFMGAAKSMVDYFHLELVHTLANDDPALLGQDYPGPLNGQIAAHA